MAAEETFAQQTGRFVVTQALSAPGMDFVWPPLPSVAAGNWMADAVEIAVLEVLAPQGSQAFAMKVGAR